MKKKLPFSSTLSCFNFCSMFLCFPQMKTMPSFDIFIPGSFFFSFQACFPSKLKIFLEIENYFSLISEVIKNTSIAILLRFRFFPVIVTVNFQCPTFRLETCLNKRQIRNWKIWSNSTLEPQYCCHNPVNDAYLFSTLPRNFWRQLQKFSSKIHC